MIYWVDHSQLTFFLIPQFCNPFFYLCQLSNVILGSTHYLPTWGAVEWTDLMLPSIHEESKLLHLTAQLTVFVLSCA